MSKRAALFVAAALAGLGMLAPAALAHNDSAFQARQRSYAAPMIRIGSPLPGLGPLGGNMGSHAEQQLGGLRRRGRRL